MDFAELNDGIGADDWLIRREEITRKRLIRRTMRYNVYKGDWFGDVLIYEPNEQARKANERDATDLVDELELERQNQLNSRFHELKLSIDSQHRPNAPSTPNSPTISICSETGSLESGYSSISSSPQYYTKHSQTCGFEFPSCPSEAPYSNSSNSRLTNSLSLESDRGVEDAPTSSFARLACSEEPGSARRPRATFPVVLNKDSFSFGARENNYCRSGTKLAQEPDQVCDNYASESCWFELNELRLIAHENFMLFMGACLEAELFGASTANKSTALVMEMSHPRASSLFNLLHVADSATFAQSPSSTSFLGHAIRAARPRLDTEAKLNICRQVTNAMTYLHDKNIVHGKLTSVNIYIELNQQVKISLIDNDEQQLAAQQWPGSLGAHFDRRALTYLSPEIVSSIRLVNTPARGPIELDLGMITSKADVYSFGTLLFELFEERLPFTVASSSSSSPSTNAAHHHLGGRSQLIDLAASPSRHRSFESPDTPTMFNSSLLRATRTTPSTRCQSNMECSASELFYRIGAGKTNEINKSRPKCPPIIDQIIEACWRPNSSKRPSFKQILF